MCLRAEAGEIDDKDCLWWTKFQTLSNQQQLKMISSKTKKPRSSKVQ